MNNMYNCLARIAVNMLKSIILLNCFVVFAFAICKDDCHSPHTKHYKELGCKPVYEDGNCCPVRYDCAIAKDFATDKCYFNGLTYNVGQKVEDKAMSRMCMAGCFCDSRDPSSGVAKFICAHIDCAEFFTGPPNASCILQYKKDACCSSGKVCGDDKKKLATCTFEGETYFEGQRMHPKNKKCYSCLCTKDFDTTTIEENPNCWEADCGTQIRNLDKVRKGCVPVYYGDVTCCPITWRCPDKKDRALPSPLKKAISTDPNMKCKFGDLELNIDDTVSSDDKCVECSCNIPPMVECVRKQDCH